MRKIGGRGEGGVRKIGGRGEGGVRKMEGRCPTLHTTLHLKSLCRCKEGV